MSLNGCEEDVLNSQVTKRLTVAFWNALGETEENLLWTHIKVFKNY